MQVQELITKEQSIAFTVLDESMTLSNPACPPERIQRARNLPSREALTEKLIRAEQKRIERMHQNRGITDTRVQAASERRQRYNERNERIKERVRCDEALAAQNRLIRQQQQLERLRNHINRVEEVCREQAVLRKESSERIMTVLESKLESAKQRREESLRKKQECAHHLGEKKLYFDMPNHGDDQNEHPQIVKVSCDHPKKQ